MERDWSLPLSDLVEAIAGKVTSIVDYIRFRAVCHSWRSAASPRPLHLPPQLPWLFPVYEPEPEPEPDDGNGNVDSTLPFYDLSAGKCHMLDLPETLGAEICGSSHGWLILLKGLVLSLLNPITHATVPLPLVTAPPAALGNVPAAAHAHAHAHALDNDNWEWEADKYAVQPTDDFYVDNAMLTSNPLHPSCLVFVTAGGPWFLAFCKIGDERWAVMDLKENLPPQYYIDDFAYSNGRLYTITDSGVGRVYDLNKPSRVRFNWHVDFPRYVVDVVSGDILLISLDWVDEGPTTEYSVYKLISNGEEPYWIKMWDIGRRNVVLSASSTYSDNFISTTNVQFQEWGTNCLFWHTMIGTVKMNQQQSLALSYDHSIRLVRLDDWTITDITGNFSSFQNNIEKPLWLTPSLL